MLHRDLHLVEQADRPNEQNHCHRMLGSRELQGQLEEMRLMGENWTNLEVIVDA